MGLTQIQSNTSSSFVQPRLGGVVAVIIDAGIDWLKVGGYVHIQGGGVYKIESIVGFVVDLTLETATAAEGEVVQADLIYPINRGEDGISTTWGGTNGKEW